MASSQAQVHSTELQSTGNRAALMERGASLVGAQGETFNVRTNGKIPVPLPVQELNNIPDRKVPTAARGDEVLNPIQ